MLFALLLIVNVMVCIALVGVVLLQQSEGGALGMGSGPSGFMTARGAGDLLTRTTWILATVFIVLSLGLNILQARETAAANAIDAKAVGKIDLSKFQQPSAPAPVAPTTAPASTTTSAPAALQAPSPTLTTPAPSSPLTSSAPPPNLATPATK